MTVAERVIPAYHTKDPKQVIWDDLTDPKDKKKSLLDNIKPTSGDVVICVYERPKEIDLGGGKKLLTPDNYQRTAEDKFQGTVGMIVKVGPEYGKHRQSLALDPMPNVGDWVAFKSIDCVPFVLGTRAMRLLQGNFIRMVLSDPDCII